MEDNKQKQHIKKNDIIKALIGLGYPKSELPDAAERMSAVPQLALDMIKYVEIGFPVIDPKNKKIPPMLLRKLPGEFTVASLMADYLLEPTGAFLMAVELFTHYEEAMNMIEKIIVDGLNIRQKDGKYVNIDVPAAERYPECEVCGTKLVKKHIKCPECGSDTNL